MLPLFDENPTDRQPVVTWLLIGACVVFYAATTLGVGTRPATILGIEAQRDVPSEVQLPVEWAAIPCEILSDRPLSIDEVRETFLQRPADQQSCRTDDPGVSLFPDKRVKLAILTSLFLHDGIIHLGINMLFLWIFGNNIEDRLGHVGYLAFYLVGGVVATVAYAGFVPDGTVPIVGASGAVAGVMGAYLVWYPDAPIRTLLFLILVDIRARWYLTAWFAIQFFTWSGPGGWIAHVAGFVYGAIVGTVLRRALPLLRLRPGQRPAAWDRTGGAGHGPYPHLDEVWAEPHPEQYGA